MKKLAVPAFVMFFIFGMVTSINASPTNGLVAEYLFGGSANDTSGYQNDGVVYGATLTPDRFGNAQSAYSFDGVDDFIRIEPSGTNSSFDEITISLWVKILGYPANKVSGIFTRWNQDRELGAYYGLYYDNYVYPNTITGASYEYYSLFLTLPVKSEFVSMGEWIFVTYTISPINGYENLFINGQLVDQVTRTLPMRASDLPIIIGADIKTYQQQDYWRFFNGIIDDVRIYNRALSACEVEELYTGQPACVPTYSCSGFEPPCDSSNVVITVKKNKCIPLKTELFNSDGLPVTDADIESPPVLFWENFSGASESSEAVVIDGVPPGEGTVGNQFKFIGGRWCFNLKLKDFYTAPGTYRFKMMTGNQEEYIIEPAGTVRIGVER